MFNPGKGVYLLLPAKGGAKRKSLLILGGAASAAWQLSLAPALLSAPLSVGSFSVSIIFFSTLLFPSLSRRYYWRRHRYSIGYASLLSLPDLAIVIVIVLNDFGCIVQQVFSSLFAASSPLGCRAQGLYPRVWLRMYRYLFLKILGST